jgi:SpoVK/Ycf46/Vps4 family AAA+-type ATPase
MHIETHVEELKPQAGKALKEITLIPPLKEIEEKISRTIEFFFKEGFMKERGPLKGFLLEGPPGTGKTEVIKQVANQLDRRMGGIFYIFVDGATIASPKWGDAEKTLKRIFDKVVEELQNDTENSKLIILFDDIESLMIARGESLAKEWHYSINSVLFHAIDKLDSSRIMVCATTNKPELVDDALRSRLYPIKVPPASLEDMANIVDEILDASRIEDADKKKVRALVLNELRKLKEPTIRDAQQITVMNCIETGAWRV